MNFLAAATQRRWIVFFVFFYLGPSNNDCLPLGSCAEQIPDKLLEMDFFLVAPVPNFLSVTHLCSAECVTNKQVSDYKVNLQPELQ